MSAIPLPSIWTPRADERARSASWWSRHLRGLRDSLSVFTAGKEQRNPANGKGKRNVSNGKTKNNTDTNTACCCGSICADCPSIPASFALSTTSIDNSCWSVCQERFKLDFPGNDTNGTFTLDYTTSGGFGFPASDATQCVWRYIYPSSTGEAFGNALLEVYTPGCAEFSALALPTIGWVLVHTSGGGWTLSCYFHFGTLFRNGLLFQANLSGVDGKCLPDSMTFDSVLTPGGSGGDCCTPPSDLDMCFSTGGTGVVTPDA